MQKEECANLELFYDVVDESNNILYEATHKNYFELIELTVSNILAGEVVCDVDLEYQRQLEEVYAKIANVDFTVEDVRKAMQAIILKGFKEMRIPNGQTTPDTLGIFMAYLITKMTALKKISIMDPLCGTGNLLFSIVNHLEADCRVFACDIDPLMTKLTKLTADLLNQATEIYLQDCLSLTVNNLDFIVCDFPSSKCQADFYFPYEAIKHFVKMLAEKGAILAIVEADFFNYDRNQNFKKELLNYASIIGIAELPESIFVSKPKSIIVIKKGSAKDNKNCFMVKLPSFTDVKEFNSALLEIEAWFEKNK